MNLPPLVLIEWEDAYSGNYDWLPRSEMADKALIVFSAGLEVDANDERITLALNYQPESDLGSEKISDLMTIPRGMVRKRTVFKVD